MNILHVIDSLDPAAGGPPVIAASLASAQQQLGHQVTLACYRHESPDRFDDDGIPGISKIRILLLPRGGRVERLSARAAGPLLDAAVAEVDVVHLHNVWEPILVRAAKSARLREIPYVVLLNGMLDPWSLRQKSLKKQVALMFGRRKMLDNAAALHLGNRDEERLIAPLGLQARTAVVPNGIGPRRAEALPASGMFRESLPTLQHAPFILFLSRLHYKKGLDVLADAFTRAAKRCDAHLVVAGPDGGAREAFERQISSAGLAGRVHVVGPLYGNRKWAALKDADLWTLPSRQEGFSIAVLEAMSFGKAVVISEDCHFPEVEQEEAGLLLPLKAERFADAFIELVNDPHRRERYGERARALVMDRFIWPRVAEQTISLYQSLQ